MHAQLLAIVLRTWAALHAPKDAMIADAIAAAVERAHVFDRELLAATMATYSALESGNRMHPEAWSHDAREGQSCGIWQAPCTVVRHFDAPAQARYWVWCVTHSSLASVDSDPARAKRRLRLAHGVLVSMQ